jgi:hypothetical protein
MLYVRLLEENGCGDCESVPVDSTMVDTEKHKNKYMHEPSLVYVRCGMEEEPECG